MLLLRYLFYVIVFSQTMLQDIKVLDVTMLHFPEMLHPYHMTVERNAICRRKNQYKYVKEQFIQIICFLVWGSIS